LNIANVSDDAQRSMPFVWVMLNDFIDIDNDFHWEVENLSMGTPGYLPTNVNRR